MFAPDLPPQPTPHALTCAKYLAGYKCDCGFDGSWRGYLWKAGAVALLSILTVCFLTWIVCSAVLDVLKPSRWRAV